jgi:hypothetical protein
MIFDFSENIRPYFLQNEKISDSNRNAIHDEIAANNMYLYILTKDTPK